MSHDMILKDSDTSVLDSSVLDSSDLNGSNNDIVTLKNLLKYIYQQKQLFTTNYGAQDSNFTPSTISYPLDLLVCKHLTKYEGFLRLFYKILESSQKSPSNHFLGKNHMNLWDVGNLKTSITVLDNYLSQPFPLSQKLRSALQKMIDTIDKLVPIRA